MMLPLPDDALLAFGQAGQMTGLDFRTDVAALASALRRRRIQRGAIMTADGYRFTVALFALFAADATAVLPPNGQPGTLAALAGQYDLLLGDGEVADPTADRSCWDGRLDAQACRIDFFTSGSTGAPKCISRRLDQLVREIAQLERRWGAGSEQAPVFATVSHQHIFGLTFRLLWPLMTGRPFATHSHDLWETLLAAMPAGAIVISSPAHLDRLEGLHSKNKPRLLFSAGAPLPFTAASRAAALFDSLPHEIYGSTETGAIATRQQRHADTPWTPLAGNRIAADEQGQLRLLSPYASEGDWMALPDRIELLPKGFRLLGRLDRVVKIAGKRIELDDVEAALRRLPEIADAAVLPLPGDDPILAAAVQLSEQGAVSLARLGAFRLSRRLRAALAATLEPAGRPRRWRFVPALPRTAMHKTVQSDLADLFAKPAADA